MGAFVFDQRFYSRPSRYSPFMLKHAGKVLILSAVWFGLVVNYSLELEGQVRTVRWVWATIRKSSL